MKRLKTLCVVLLIIFFGSLFQGAVMPFIEGLKFGLSIARYESDHQKDTDEFLLIDVVSKNHDFIENKEVNLKTGEPIMVQLSTVSIIINSLPNKPVWWKILQSFYAILTLGVLILGIWIPFLVVRILKSLQNSQVFDRANLARINRIGVILLLVGIVGTVIQVINIYSAQYMVELVNYKFSYAKAVDFNAIIMGVIVLIMNEVLKISIEIKEEQDLTI